MEHGDSIRVVNTTEEEEEVEKKALRLEKPLCLWGLQDVTVTQTQEGLGRVQEIKDMHVCQHRKRCDETPWRRQEDKQMPGFIICTRVKQSLWVSHVSTHRHRTSRVWMYDRWAGAQESPDWRTRVSLRGETVWSQRGRWRKGNKCGTFCSADWRRTISEHL